MKACPRSSDTLPAFCRARVLILGVGNVLCGDDGFGPTAVDHLIRHYHIPADVYVMDVGTGVRKLLFTLALGENLPEEIVIVDAVDGGKGDWRVGEIPLETLTTRHRNPLSLHDPPTSNLLRELQALRGVNVTVVACDVGAVPRTVRPGLSPRARRAVSVACRNLAERFVLKRSRACLAEESFQSSSDPSLDNRLPAS